MLTIRNKTFETNSSSAHTVTIGDSCYYGGAPDQHDLQISCRGTGEYGWERREYSTPEELLDYAAVAYCMLGTDEDTLAERMHEIGECFARHGVTIDWHEMDDTNNRLCYNQNHFGTEFCEGYIDHQSAPNELDEAAEVAKMFAEDAEKLYQFVFGGDSSVVTGNDN